MRLAKTDSNDELQSARQAETHTRATQLRAAKFQFAAVQSGNGMGDREAESAALAHAAFGAMEAFGEARRVACGKSCAIIVDFE